MASILEAIVRDKRAEVDARRAAVSLTELERRCRDLAPPRDFAAALRPAAGGVALIAEVKRASPSRGVLAAGLDPATLARTYAAGGAAAISVLTDRKYFHGSLDDLGAVRAAVATPLLRKDFTLDEYQLWESRAAGADAVLLIVAILEPARLGDLLHAAKGLGLAALVEVHSAGELDRALQVGASILGINNRDLTTFETRLETTLALAPTVPPGPVVVGESGYEHAEEVRRAVAAGVHAVLVGEALVRAADVQAKLRELRLAGGISPREPGPSSLPARTGGEMGGASRPTHSP
jgi:indole-3-glycerol phosphate synthase